MVIWFVVLIPTLDPRLFLDSLKRPACLLPVAFFALAIVGTLWADGPWVARLYGISPVTKLLAIPFLLHHFERSQRGVWVFVAFFGVLYAVDGGVLGRRFRPQSHVEA